jgi:hypothetical protein
MCWPPQVARGKVAVLARKLHARALGSIERHIGPTGSFERHVGPKESTEQHILANQGVLNGISMAGSCI